MFYFITFLGRQNKKREHENISISVRTRNEEQKSHLFKSRLQNSFTEFLKYNFYHRFFQSINIFLKMWSWKYIKEHFYLNWITVVFYPLIHKQYFNKNKQSSSVYSRFEMRGNQFLHFFGLILIFYFFSVHFYSKRKSFDSLLLHFAKLSNKKSW